MDPVSHVAFGRSLIALIGPDRRTPGMVGAAVLGSLAPDLDAVFMPFGWDRYLRAHEIGTHAIAGTLACAALTAAVVRAARRDTAYVNLAAAAWLGALSHVTLDLVSGAHLRLAWPISDRYASLPLVAMADPYLLSLLVLTVVGGWLLRHRHQRTAAAAGLLIVAAFLGVKGALALRAVSAYEATAAATPDPTDARIVEAGWGRIRQWTIFDRTGTELRAWRANAGDTQPELLLQWPRARPTGLADRSRLLSTVRNFLHAHELALVTTLPLADGGSAVLWSDIRFCWDPAKEVVASGAIDAPPDVQPVAALDDGRRLACGLWFGGEFDREGRPVREVVWIGSIRQTR